MPDDRTVLAPLPEPTGVSGRAADGVWKAVGEREESVFVQEQPAMEWHITHSLGCTYPVVTLVTSDGEPLVGYVDWPSASQNYLKVLFHLPTSGKAIIHK